MKHRILTALGRPLLLVIYKDGLYFSTYSREIFAEAGRTRKKTDRTCDDIDKHPGLIWGIFLLPYPFPLIFNENDIIAIVEKQ